MNAELKKTSIVPMLISCIVNMNDALHDDWHNTCLWPASQIPSVTSNEQQMCLFRFSFTYDDQQSCSLPLTLCATLKHPAYSPIDLLHKSHDAPVLYSTMHHFVAEMCICVHISVTTWCIVEYLPDALWDLGHESIGTLTVRFLQKRYYTYNNGLVPRRLLDIY